MWSDNVDRRTAQSRAFLKYIYKWVDLYLVWFTPVIVRKWCLCVKLVYFIIEHISTYNAAAVFTETH